MPGLPDEDLSDEEVNKLVLENFLDEYESHHNIDLEKFEQAVVARDISVRILEQHREELEKQRTKLLVKHQDIMARRSIVVCINPAYFSSLREEMDPNYSSLLYHILFLMRRLIMILLAFRLQTSPMI